MLPGFLFAPLGGALIDRWNRKVVMVTCDIGRAGLLALLPFWQNIWGLVILSFLIEMLTLLWGPAKDASVPNIVTDPEQLASANSLGLVAAFGTFPLGAALFAVLAVVAPWLADFHQLSWFEIRKESLAIWVDGATFLLSAFLISRLQLPETERGTRRNVPASQTWRDIKDGLGFIRANPLVRGVMIGLAGGLIGGGAIVPLGAKVAQEVLGGGAAAFGLLMIALGVGAAIGVVTLLWLQRRLPRQAVFTTAIVANRRLDHRGRVHVFVGTGIRARGRIGRVRRLRLRDGFHAVAGKRLRRDARPHVRNALHDRARLPALVAHDRAVRSGRTQRDLPARGERARRRRFAAHLVARCSARAVARRRDHSVVGRGGSAANA